jgi:hypothetical protein
MADDVSSGDSGGVGEAIGGGSDAAGVGVGAGGAGAACGAVVAVVAVVAWLRQPRRAETKRIGIESRIGGRYHAERRSLRFVKMPDFRSLTMDVRPIFGHAGSVTTSAKERPKRLLAQPRITAWPGRLLVRFGSSTAEIRHEPGNIYRWAVGDHTGEALTFDVAFLRAWGVAARGELPPPVVEPELAAIVDKVKDDAAWTADCLRDLLRKRTGFSWSVRRGRGRAADRIYVKPPRRRLLASGSMRGEDAAFLAAIFGSANLHHGVTVPPTRHARAAALWSVAGCPGEKQAAQ